MTIRPWLLGLRPRLVLAFVVVALASGTAATAVSYREARNDVLAVAQDAALERFRDDVVAASASLPYPPDKADLDDFTRRLPGNILAVYGNLHTLRLGNYTARTGRWPDVPVDEVFPPRLRQRVRSGGMFFQREILAGRAYLAIGTMLLGSHGASTGVEVYTITGLFDAQQSIERLARSTTRTIVLSLVPAVVLALLAARDVLRPVRLLREGTRRLAAGRLDTRLPVRGSDELADLVSTFNNTAGDLEHSVNRLRQMEADAHRFVADVSHELRTPLAAMTAVTDTLDEEAARLPGDAAAAARLVSSQTQRLAQLVENLIEISRFDAGGARLVLDGEVDLAAAVTAALAARGWLDLVGTGELATDLPSGVTAELDRRRLEVVVANLVGNALRHGAAPVRVAVRGGQEAVELTVSDSGTGLAPEVLPHVFDRFYKADTARTASKGSGLGLAIALENARLHGGAIEAANRPEGGAVFRVVLPRQQPAAVPGRLDAGLEVAE